MNSQSSYSTWILAVLIASGGGCGSTETGPPRQLVLPGDQYYPESINAAADGTLFVSSVGTGQVLKFAAGATTSTVLLAATAPQSAAGVLADSSSSTLYLCAFLDLTKMPPPNELRAYDLGTGALKATYTFPMPAFCNDLALGANGDLFVTDSFGKVYELVHGAASLVVWSTDPLLAPASPTGLAADGIVLDRAGNVYVNTFDTGRLIRIPLQGDGTAGVAAEIVVDSPLKAPDGMRMLAMDTLVVVEGAAGRLTKVAITGNTGTTTTLASSLNGPSSVVKVGDNYWVTEGQLGHFLGTIPGPPSLPFLVKRIP